MSARILVVEDDEPLGEQLVRTLTRGGYEATWVKDGDEAARLDVSPFALVVLDLMLPGTYGLDVLKRLRARSEVPVLILSAREDAADKVRALSLGADDYVTKPFWPDELLARVKARLRRPALERSGEAAVVVGGLRIDPSRREVHVDGAPVELTKVEFDLLHALVRRRGAPASRAQLVDDALDPDAGGTERTLDVHISRLRKKLGAEGARIATVWGIGYRLARDEGGP